MITDTRTYQKEYRERNKAKAKSYREAYRALHPEKFKSFNEHHNRRLREYHSTYFKKYRETYDMAGYIRDRKKNDIQFRIGVLLRVRLAVALKKNQRGGSAVKDLGCTLPQFKKHIESLFLPGMKWENWAFRGWHIDHIIPLTAFDLTDPEQVKKACHYTNLQPMWWRENISKGGAKKS